MDAVAEPMEADVKEHGAEPRDDGQGPNGRTVRGWVEGDARQKLIRGGELAGQSGKRGGDERDARGRPLGRRPNCFRPAANLLPCTRAGARPAPESTHSFDDLPLARSCDRISFVPCPNKLLLGRG